MSTTSSSSSSAPTNPSSSSAPLSSPTAVPSTPSASASHSQSHSTSSTTTSGTATTTNLTNLSSSQQQQPQPQLPHGQQQPVTPPSPRALAEARAALTTSLTTLGSSLTADLALRAQDVHGASKALTSQQQDLERETTSLERESKRHKDVLDRGEKALKELGDLQNWAEMLERDVLVLEEVVRRKEGGGEVRRGEGSGVPME